MTFCLCSRTEVMECHFVHSAGLSLWNNIWFIQQDLGYGMTFVLSAGLRLRNVILFIQ